MQKTIREPVRDIPVFDECDILVVGGGAAGHSAALAAARAGCKNIVLMERYGYMGGDVTGGYVIMVPNLSWYDKSFVRGIQEEWFDRLEKIPGAVLGPGFDEIGSEDPLLLSRWRAIHDCTSRLEEVSQRVVRAVYYEPNQLKIEMDKMLIEHSDSIRVYYHAWATAPVMEDGKVKGIIFESKQGRQAILAKVVIDASGDGDIFAQTGAPYNDLSDPTTRVSATALVFRVGGIDYNVFYEWQLAHPEAHAAMRDSISKIAGFRMFPIATNQNDMVWFNNMVPDRSCIDIKDLTYTEMAVRDKIRDIIEFMRNTIPGAFKDAFLVDIAPQTGVRCSRRLKGEYIMTPNDFAFATRHDDVIAWHCTISQINESAPVEIPYRAMLPQHIDNLLAPGRHISADAVAIDWLLLIPQCVGTGQAAGVAAAVAVADGTSVRNVNIRKVQDILAGEQDVPLPRNSHTDPSLTELCEEKEYGLYTSMAKAAAAERERADGQQLKQYRQW